MRMTEGFTNDVTTIDDLTGSLLFSGSVEALRESTRDRFDLILSGAQRAKEPDVTDFISMFSGPLEESAIRFLCDRAERDYDPRMRILSGRDFAVASGQTDRRRFDTVVAIREVPGDDSSWAPAIVVEAKFDAEVHCPNCRCAPAGYRNQITCYPQCVNDRVKIDIDNPDEKRTVSFVWLCNPHRHGPDFGPWGKKAVYEAWAQKQGQRELDALKIQNKYLDLWKPAHWADLGRWLAEDKAGTGIGTHPALPAITRFIRAV